MAVYSDATVSTFSEVKIAITTFLTTNGWSIGTETTLNGINSFSTTKNGNSHNIALATNGTFKAGVVNFYYGSDYRSPSIVYTNCVGLAHGSYPLGDYLIAHGFAYPMRCLFFELANNSLMFSFETAYGKWRHVLSGNTASPVDGITAFMSASSVPASSYGLGSLTDVALLANGYNSTYAINTFLSTSSNYLQKSTDSTAGRGGRASLCVYKKNNVWISAAPSPADITVSTDSHDVFNKYLLNIFGKNHFTAIPVFFPVLFFNTTTKRILYQVPDIFMCSAAVCTPGSKISLGAQDYFTLPFGDYDATGACMAVRCN